MSLVKTLGNSPVYDMQVMLAEVMPEQELNPDGIFGNNTKNAVCAFQKSAALPVTGEVNETTWNRLREEYQKDMVFTQPARPVQIVMQPNQTIKAEEENLNLYLVQAMLHTIGKLYLSVPKVNLTGKNDAQTQKAISWLQGCSGLAQTGQLDKNTWRHLSELYRCTVGDGTGCYPCHATQRHIAPPENVPMDV